MAIHPDKITEICTLYDFKDGKNMFSQVYEGEFLEHKKGEIIHLREERANKKEVPVRGSYRETKEEILEGTRVRKGDYKIINIDYKSEFGGTSNRLRKDYTLKKVKRSLLSKLVNNTKNRQ